MIPIICPKCGNEISGRNLNPATDMAFCDHCKTAHSYRELMGKAAEEIKEEPKLPDKWCFTYAANPDGTERIARKQAGSILTAACFLVGCSVVGFLSLTGRMPLQYTFYAIGIALMIIFVALNRYNIITLDKRGRQMSIRHGFTLRHVVFEEIEHIDTVQFEERSDSFRLRAVLKTGEYVDVADNMKADDAEYLCFLIERRVFSR